MSEARALGLLRALCSGLTPGGIEVVADDQRTAFVPKRKRIMVARRFLSADTPVGIGALLHEVGHVLVTRYHLFTEPPDVPQALWWQALNAVEETRVHRFLRRRLPGVGGYLDALFAMDEAPGPDAFESDLVVFLAATAAWDRHPSLPFLAGFPAAEAAFHRTEPARSSYTRTLPPPELMPLPNLDQRYERLVLSGLEAPALVAPAMVAPALVTTDSGSVVPLEAEVRCAAASALRVFGAGIWPEIMALAARDQARIARSVADDPDLRLAAERDDAEAVREHPVLARQALRAWMDAHGTEQAPEPHPDGDLAKLAWGLLRRYLEADRSLQQSHRSAGPMRGRIRAKGTRDTDDLSSAGFSEAREPPAGQPMAEETQRARSALVDVLRRAVPTRPVRWTSGHRSGTAIDLDRAMLAAATSRDADRIWVRRTAERPALAALLLVDLSGSMGGQKVKAAIAATRALSAALAEVRGISWCVLGFQDTTIPFVRFEERGEPHVLARIDDMSAEVAGTRPGGNNKPRYNDDGPCLLEAAATLQARPERDRLLMVISDGNPEGRRSSREDLHRAVAQVQSMRGMTLVGLGLGPSTEHVTDYYPVSQANIALGDLAPAIGRLLASGLRAAAN
jgi:Mg-chelatase subunit ChlD